MKNARHFVKRQLTRFPAELSAYSIDHCIELTRLALKLDSRNADLNYYMAYFYAVAGKSGRSLIYIKRALKFGFPSVRKFTHSTAFRSVRTLPGFWQALENNMR